MACDRQTDKQRGKLQTDQDRAIYIYTASIALNLSTMTTMQNNEESRLGTSLATLKPLHQI